ncbi:MAG: hypothetical protein HY303_05920 [Candidatus Wallbacteria bacterium]|nr:hypothetical protein [Candidatus Wallbacteria bacterium]
MLSNRRYRVFLLALRLSIAAHLLGLATTATILAPGLDLAARSPVRSGYVAEHATLWRLGWLPWHATALLDLAVSLALALLLASRAGRRGLVWAWFGAGFTLLAVLADLWGQGMMATTLVEAAAKAAPGSQSAQVDFMAVESRALFWTGTLSTWLYVGMLGCWTLAGARAAGGLGRRKGLVAAGVVTGALFVALADVNLVAVALGSVDLGYPYYDLLRGLCVAAFALLLPFMAWLGRVLAPGPVEDQEDAPAAA